jgi:acyl-coenzyme A thioesterase PaaI-like protein
MPLEDWNVGLAKHIGIRFVEATRDKVVAEVVVKPELMTTTGTIHGGTLMVFTDPNGRLLSLTIQTQVIL